MRTRIAAALALLLAACSNGRSGGTAPAEPGLAFPEGFLFGAATSAEQTEGGNTNNNWYQFTRLPEYAALHAGPSGVADDSYNRFPEDVALAAAMGLNAYRFSIEWSRVMPSRRTFSDRALAHYGAVIDAARAAGMEPWVTLHHFSEPIWLQDLRDPDCARGASDDNLCGWPNPDAPAAFAEFCGRVGAAYGDRVDRWATFNEPNVYISNGYLAGGFPPARLGILDLAGEVIPVARGLFEGHARCYDALKAADTVDADGDGAAAEVGWTMSAEYAFPADPASAAHVRARERVDYIGQGLYLAAVTGGTLDADIDGAPDETHPDWADRLDWLGVQYYAASAAVPLPFPPPLDATACSDTIAAVLGDLGSLLLDAVGCPPAPVLDFPIPGYTGPAPRHYGGVHQPTGLRKLLNRLSAEYPGRPLYVTENGFGVREADAARGPLRRARSIVRTLEQVHKTLEDGVDLRGYFHWSLLDNYEWLAGFDIRFGLYGVDYATLARSPTEASRVYGEIASARALPDRLIEEYGSGDGPLSEP